MQALETELRELRDKQGKSSEQLAAMEQEKQAAQAKAAYSEVERKVRLGLEGHPTYRLSSEAAIHATEALMLRQCIRTDASGGLWVVLTDPATQQPATYNFADGLTKFLESPAGQYYRPSVPGGMGAAGSSVGRPPVSIPGGAPGAMPSGAHAVLDFQSAVEEQRRQSGGGGVR
jgi:hypothetical protein